MCIENFLKNKGIDKFLLIKAIADYLKDDIFPKETGTFILKKELLLRDDLKILVHSVLYFKNDNEEYVSVNIWICSEKNRKICEYSSTTAQYQFHFDLKTQEWSCTKEEVSQKLSKAQAQSVNDWSKSVLFSSKTT